MKLHGLSLVALMGSCVSAGIAQAQTVNFACPKAGIVEHRGSFKITYTGATAIDAYTCARLDPWGKPATMLFNIYALSSTNNTPAANAAARAGMTDLLSGRKTAVSFPYVASNGFAMQETWKFSHKDTISLDGKTLDVVVFDLDRVADPKARSDFHGSYKQWLDPKNGLWVKSELTVVGGESNKYPRPYTDSSIEMP